MRFAHTLWCVRRGSHSAPIEGEIVAGDEQAQRGDGGVVQPVLDLQVAVRFQQEAVEVTSRHRSTSHQRVDDLIAWSSSPPAALMMIMSGSPTGLRAFVGAVGVYPEVHQGSGSSPREVRNIFFIVTQSIIRVVPNHGCSST